MVTFSKIETVRRGDVIENEHKIQFVVREITNNTATITYIKSGKTTRVPTTFLKLGAYTHKREMTELEITDFELRHGLRKAYPETEGLTAVQLYILP